jgi:hypothetical protein
VRIVLQSGSFEFERIDTVRLAFRIYYCSYGNSIEAEENGAHKSRGIQLKPLRELKGHIIKVYLFQYVDTDIFRVMKISKKRKHTDVNWAHKAQKTYIEIKCYHFFCLTNQHLKVDTVYDHGAILIVCLSIIRYRTK